MNFIRSLRQLVSKTADQSKASDSDDDDDSSSSSTRTSSETQSSSAAITTSGKKTQEDTDADDDEDSESDEEEKGNSQETEVQHDEGKEEEGSDNDDFAETAEEEENDPYADIVASLSSFVMSSIRASRIPTDMISTRSARDGDISPREEEADEEEEEKGTEEDTKSAETAYDDDVRTAGTVPSQTCLLARKPDDAQITGTQGSQPPAFESPNWKGEPNASRRPPCECLARGRATCTCAFRLSGVIDGNVLEEERAATISNPNHHAPDFESPQWHGEPNASRGPHCECLAKDRSTCTCSFVL